MLLEVRAVGRKTPQDGRLEVSEPVYRRLAILARPLLGRVDAHEATATLDTLSCAKCAGHEAGHLHHFIQSEVFRALAPGEHCVITLLDDGRTIDVARPHPI